MDGAIASLVLLAVLVIFAVIVVAKSVALIPQAEAYRAPRWLLGGHVQTIYPALFLRGARPRLRRERWDTPDGDFVELRVADDGDGMTPEVLHRSVDPFFTTKAGGHASGLGLSICRGIVELSGGHFHVDSVNGQGTVVTSLWRTSESGAG